MYAYGIQNAQQSLGLHGKPGVQTKATGESRKTPERTDKPPPSTTQEQPRRPREPQNRPPKSREMPGKDFGQIHRKGRNGQNHFPAKRLQKAKPEGHARASQAGPERQPGKQECNARPRCSLDKPISTPLARSRTPCVAGNRRGAPQH